MGEKEFIIIGLRKFLYRLNKSMRIEKIFLFGSRANNNPKKDSDIDLVVVSPDFEGLGFFKRCYLMYDFWNMNYPVDFLCYTPKEFNKLKKQITIVREAVNNGIEII